VTRELCTIGVYGFDADRFFATLLDAAVDLIVDIRRRRGVRGPQYAFANARRLIDGLTRHGIAYEHLLELAPSTELLALQHEIDRRGAGVRARAQLAPEYVRRYRAEILGRADLHDIAEGLRTFVRPALLCVETQPEVCHRALAAGALAPKLGATLRHLLPSD
jgi:uncharacterized protein (DUF488 family)